MKIIWSNFASEAMVEIFRYYKGVASEKVARKIKSNIFFSTKQLIKYPNSGQVEISLA